MMAGYDSKYELILVVIPHWSLLLLFHYGPHDDPWHIVVYFERQWASLPLY